MFVPTPAVFKCEICVVWTCVCLRVFVGRCGRTLSECFSETNLYYADVGVSLYASLKL
jgi:hypothetical protein